MRRLFLALDLSAETRKALAESVFWMGEFSDRVHVIPPDNYHVTLKFLGAVPEDRISTVEALVAREAAAFKPFDLQMNRWGVFPEIGHPAVFWAGTDPAGPAGQMFDRCEKVLEEQGFLPERRPFTAHVTLARAGRDRRAPAEFLERWKQLPAPALPKFQIQAVTLYESLPGGETSVYQALESFPLDGRIPDGSGKF